MVDVRQVRRSEAALFLRKRCGKQWRGGKEYHYHAYRRGLVTEKKNILEEN